MEIHTKGRLAPARYAWATCIKNPLSKSHDPSDNTRRIIYTPGLIEPYRHKTYKRNMLCCSKVDPFGSNVSDDVVNSLLGECEGCENHNILFLTTNAQRLRSLPAENHIWYGVTMNSDDDAWRLTCFPKGCTNTFVRIGPLSHPLRRETIEYIAKRISWVILSADDWFLNESRLPEPEWIREVVDGIQDIAKKPIFMEASLRPVCPDPEHFIQQLPYAMSNAIAKNNDKKLKVTQTA